MFHDISLPQLPQEVFVVSDYDQLEVGMVLAFVYDTVVVRLCDRFI